MIDDGILCRSRIVVAGAPGSGKTTLASRIGEWEEEQNLSPRPVIAIDDYFQKHGHEEFPRHVALALRDLPAYVLEGVGAPRVLEKILDNLVDKPALEEEMLEVKRAYDLGELEKEEARQRLSEIRGTINSSVELPHAVLWLQPREQLTGRRRELSRQMYEVWERIIPRLLAEEVEVHEIPQSELEE